MAEQDAGAAKSRILRLLFALTVLAFVALFGKRELDHYVEEDPRFCQSCHVVRPEVAVWASESHARVACQGCHGIDRDQMQKMLTSSVLGWVDAPHPSLDQEHIRCRSCHDKRGHNMVAVEAHRLEARNDSVVCLKCHASRIHGIALPEQFREARR